MLRFAIRLFAPALLLVVCCAHAQSDARCGVMPVVARDSQPNIFSEQQEMWLGQVEADQLEADVVPVRDARLNEHLQSVADRLLATLPATKIQIRVLLIDSDEVNAYSLAGGHIYVTRKLVSVARSDDELAGVLGHEIGHIMSHQFAFDTTREMQRLLHVTSVSDEADIRAKFAAMLDAEEKAKHPELREGGEETQADQIGVYVATAAGYRPQAGAEFWNRVFFVGGKTGNRMMDLFGLTKPDEKRLRGMERMAAALPPTCGRDAHPDESGFAAWHEAVLENQAGAATEDVKAEHEVVLTPPLQMELTRVRFSPDGRSILAQDESSIFVMSRQPFALRYRIDAEGALPANFSPDSKSITFSTPGLRTEQWSAETKKMLAVHEMLTRKPCYDSRLSPDGRTLVCVEMNDSGELSLAMLDTATSNVVWEHKVWFLPNWSLFYSLLYSRVFGSTDPVFLSSYSADNNTLLIAGGDEKLALDLKNRTVINTGGGIRGGITGAYAFVGSDKLAGINRQNPDKSGIYSFPDGKVLKRLSLKFSTIESVSNPGDHLHLLVRDLKDYDVGLGDLDSMKFLSLLKVRALDEWDGAMAGEGADGTVLLEQWTGDPHAPQGSQQSLHLPLSPLPLLQAAAMSPDGRYLAASTSFRGALWDLTTGKQIFLIHGFTDAAWDKQDMLYLDMSKRGEVGRHIAQISMKTKAATELKYTIDEHTQMRYGRLTDWKLDTKKKTWTLELHDLASDGVVWSRTFPDVYFAYTSSLGHRDLIFSFELKAHTAKEALKANPRLAEEAAAIKDKDRNDARLIEVINGETGADDGAVVAVMPPNYAGVDGLNRAGDQVYVQGVDDRTAVYSLSSGKELRQLFGYVVALDPGTGRICTGDRVGEAMVYDADGKELAHYEMGEPLRFATFREDGSSVTILTADQKVRTVSAVGGSAPTMVRASAAN
ncbi:MAG TPA: M48 family metalloprotease [Acidobacteriaceae bacterium]|nr:M48 family metalloprotease [Acidobacteriaceae bacterium]